MTRGCRRHFHLDSDRLVMMMMMMMRLKRTRPTRIGSTEPETCVDQAASSELLAIVWVGVRGVRETGKEMIPWCLRAEDRGD